MTAPRCHLCRVWQAESGTRPSLQPAASHYNESSAPSAYAHGEIRSQIDRIWDAFWSGGISNPLEVIEQITYLLFIKRLDDLHTAEELKSARTKKPIERRVFPEGKDKKKRSYDDYRWSRFKNFAPAEMYTIVGEHVFPFLRTLGDDDSTYAHHMKDAGSPSHARATVESGRSG